MKLEKALYDKLLDKDKKSQIYFYKYCFNVLMRVAIRYKNSKDDAAVLVNDAFLKVLKNLSKFSIDKPLEPWLRRITINTAIDDFRKNKKYKETIEQMDSQLYQNVFIDESSVDEKMNFEDVLNSINKVLPKATKLVFQLKIIDGFSHKEIASKLEIAEETSKWHIKQAKKILRINKDKLIN